ncbi:glycogen/starch synthase [bacterium]|nr:glycogen/starch synthase [bacterium]
MRLGGREQGVEAPSDAFIASQPAPIFAKGPISSTTAIPGEKSAPKVPSLLESARSALAQAATGIAGTVQSLAIRLVQGEKPSPIHNILSVKDRQGLALTGRNGLWVTVEKAPEVVKGGLGQVSETVPDAVNKFLGKDVRIMVPYLKAFKTSDVPFESTGIKTTLKGPDGQFETFELMQQQRPDKPVVYAIANDKYFGEHDHLYFPADQETSIGQDGIFKSIMMYNRAASELIPALDVAQVAAPPKPQTALSRGLQIFGQVAAKLMPRLGQAKGEDGARLPGPPSNLKAFDGPIDFIIGHDWLTSPLLNELDKDYAKNVGKVFYLHNTYNESRSTQAAEDVGLKIPHGHSQYSPLRIGIEAADVAIANEFYAERIVNSLSVGADYVPALQAHQAKGSVFDMHHGLSDTYCARNNANLRADGYRDLPSDFQLSSEPSAQTMATLADFKSQNKAALQKEVGLAQNPEAVVVSWVARPEPFQKGFVTVMDSMKAFLRDNPNAQLVCAGVQPEKSPDYVADWVKDLQNDKELQGRIAFPGFVNNQKVVRIAAGSDYLMLPSLYEPYGLSHLEAMRLGAVPIVHPVDGLKATTTDPGVTPLQDSPAPLRPYGQTAIFMQPMDTFAYWKALDERLKPGGAEPQAAGILENAHKNLRGALDRALSLKQQTPDQALQVAYNAMRYVEEQHSWEEISKRYVAPINAAVAAAQQRLSG